MVDWEPLVVCNHRLKVLYQGFVTVCIRRPRGLPASQPSSTAWITMGIPARVGLARSSTVQSSVQSASTRRADVRTPSREGDSLRSEVGMIAYGRD